MPEFLSLTYTLPYHLIRQMDDVARDSNRSQSEVIAEAIRLYLRTVEARREHTRISTVEGFSYQQVAVAETYLEDDPEDQEQRARAGEQQDSQEEDWEDWDEEADDEDDWEEQDWDEQDRDEQDWDEEDEEDEDGADEQAGEEGASVAPGDNEGPAPSAPAPDERPSTPRRDTRTQAHDQGDPAPSHDAPPGNAATGANHADRAAVRDAGTPATDGSGRPTALNARPDDAGVAAPDAVAEQETPTQPARETKTVAVASETREAAGLDPLVDPAAEVRRRLRKISGEPLGSMAMRSALADIVSEIDRKDYSPEDHSQKVADLARELGRARGLSGELLLQLEMAALAHDLGKASVPTDILEKRRPSPEEMAVIRQYPEFGADLLEIVPSMEPLKRLVATHQERWNGSGYPDGLQGNDIPVGAQIIALCDVYNVLTTERRYRPAYSEDRARQIIRQNIGTLWNQEIARTFLRQVIGDEDE